MFGFGCFIDSILVLCSVKISHANNRGVAKKKDHFLKKNTNKDKLALRFELRTNRFAIYCATTAPYELCNYLISGWV